MAYLPGFEHDIFISYAHLNEGADRWVSLFHERLEAQLRQFAGGLSVWRDRQLRRDELFDQTIKAAVEGSGLFLALNSHAYVGSDYCQQEVRWFCEQTQKDGWGISIGNRKRLIQALLNNIPHKNWNPAFSGATGYPFYRDFPKDDTALPCAPDSADFRDRIDELASNLFGALRAFQQEIRNRQVITLEQPTGSNHALLPSSILLDTHMKDDVQAIEVHRALRGLNVKTYFNQSEDNPGESVRILETRLRQTGRMIIVFDSVSESWVLGRLGLVSEIANKEQAAMKLGIYYGPQRRKGNGGQIRLGSLTVYEFDDADLRNPQSLLPLLS